MERDGRWQILRWEHICAMRAEKLYSRGTVKPGDWRQIARFLGINKRS